MVQADRAGGRQRLPPAVPVPVAFAEPLAEPLAVGPLGGVAVRGAAVGPVPVGGVAVHSVAVRAVAVVLPAAGALREPQQGAAGGAVRRGLVVQGGHGRAAAAAAPGDPGDLVEAREAGGGPRYGRCRPARGR
ncbi:hypothetical protein GCM10020254_68960 [Streptomyces goshikiensis]